MSRLSLALGWALVLAAGVRAGAEDYWSTTRRGANLFDRTETAERLQAAADARIEFVRVAPNKWPGAGRDFLLGDASAFTAIPKADLDALRVVLDWAQAAGVRVVVTTLSLPGNRWRQHNGNKSDFRLWREPRYADQAEAFWRQLATALRGHPALVGYNLVNEPHVEQIDGGIDFRTFDFAAWRRRVAGTPADMNGLYARLVRAIREVDAETPVILDCGVYATPWAMPGLAPLADPRVLYSFHMYEPYVYTTQKLNRGRFSYPGDVPDEGEGPGPRRPWTATTLRQFFDPVRKWQAANHVPANRILVGEFGVDRRSKGAARYLSDLVDIFEAEGWHWAFYSFREDTWDAMDYELGDGPTPPGFWEALEKGRALTVPRPDNPLFDVLKRALARGTAPTRELSFQPMRGKRRGQVLNREFATPFGRWFEFTIQDLTPLALAALLAGLPCPAAAQEAKIEPPPATFRADTALVVLDLVVRDKKGQPVRDLRSDEIQVYEDGSRREVAAFRLVAAEAPSLAADAAAAGPAGPSLNPTRLLSLTTLIFEPLDGTTAPLARRAALQFLERALGERSRVAVVRLGRGLSLVQPFTSNPDHLRRAVELVTSAAGPDAERSVLAQAQRANQYYLNLTAAAATLTPGPAGASSSSGPPPLALAAPRDPGRADEASGPCDVCPAGSDPGSVATERKLAEVQAIALRANDQIQRQQQGESTLWPLLALLKAQEELAGRKAIVYFSTGLRVPPNLDGLFRTAIGQANRSNVSIYSVDVRGLDTTRELAGVGSALRQAAAASYLQNTRVDGAVTRDEVETFDTAEDALRQNATGTLRDLSESTGGLLIANTNDIGKRLEMVASDLRLYYEVSYAPARSEFDGKFRKIEVKVARKGVAVQARSGYFALPPGGSTLFPYEVPLLGALTTRAKAHDFDIRPGIAFGEKGEPTVAVEVPLDGLPFVVDPKKKTYRLGLSILAVVKTADGQVVERLSDDFPMTGPAGKLDELRAKSAVLRRRLSVAPGDYVLEAVALEKESDRASVGQWRFSVPATEAAGAAALTAVAGAPGRTAIASTDAAAQAALARGGLGDFRLAVDRYRRGDVEGSVKARTDLPLTRVTAEVDRLARQSASASRDASREQPWTDKEVQAAALLHLDAAFAEALRGDAITAARELEIGERLATLVEDPARRSRFHREWALGAAAFYRSRYDAVTARTILERACAAAGDDMELLLERAVITETLGGRAFSGSGTPRLTAAEAGNATAGELAKAEALYRQVLASAPGQVEARLRLGRTLFLEGRHPEAIAELDQVLAGRPATGDSQLAHLFAGAALEASGDPAGARARYEKALTLAPQSRVAAMASARLLARTAKEGEARVQLARLVARTDETAPGDEPWWRYRLGGFGEDAAFEERMARLRDEVRR